VTSQTYRCLNCLDHSVSRPFNVSHVSLTCENCGEFGRFVQQKIYDKFERFEESAPEEFDWNRLDRMAKLVVAERLVRTDKTLADFDVEKRATN